MLCVNYLRKMKRLDLCCAFCKSIAKNRRYVNAFGSGKKKTLRFAYMLFGHEKHPRISWLIWREELSFWFVDRSINQLINGCVCIFFSFRAHTAFKYFRWQFFCQACLCTIRCKNFSLPELQISIASLSCSKPKTQNQTCYVLCLGSLQMNGIDEAALDNLSLVTEMTKHIRVRASQNTASTNELGQFAPLFVWLLRVSTFALLCFDSIWFQNV